MILSIGETVGPIDAAVWHRRAAEDGIVRIEHVGEVEGRALQVGIGEVSGEEVGAAALAWREIGAGDRRTGEASPPEPGAAESGAGHFCLAEIGVFKLGVTEVGPGGVGAAKVRIGEIGPGEIGAGEVSAAAQVAATEVRSGREFHVIAVASPIAAIAGRALRRRLGPDLRLRAAVAVLRAAALSRVLVAPIGFSLGFRAATLLLVLPGRGVVAENEHADAKRERGTERLTAIEEGIAQLCDRINASMHADGTPWPAVGYELARLLRADSMAGSMRHRGSRP